MISASLAVSVVAVPLDHGRRLSSRSLGEHADKKFVCCDRVRRSNVAASAVAERIDVERALSIALDADRSTVERVEAMWQFAGLPASTRTGGRTLVEQLGRALQEPQLFVSTEAVEVLGTLVVDKAFVRDVAEASEDALEEVAIGISRRGELVVPSVGFSACVPSSDGSAWCADLDIEVRRLADAHVLRRLGSEAGFLQLAPTKKTDLLVELPQRTVRVCRDNEIVDPDVRGVPASERSPARLQLVRESALWRARAQDSLLRNASGDVVSEVLVDTSEFVTIGAIPVRLVRLPRPRRAGGVVYTWWPRSPSKMRTRPAAVGEVVRIGRSRLDDFPDPRLTGHVIALGDNRFGAVLLRPELRVKELSTEELKKLSPALTAKSMKPRVSATASS
jgi:hypothetical protein